MTSLNTDNITKKLIQEEEWLRNFQANVKKSAQLREGIEGTEVQVMILKGILTIWNVYNKQSNFSSHILITRIKLRTWYLFRSHFLKNKNVSLHILLQKIILETGYTVLEKEYRSVIQKNTVQADPVIVIESLDDQFELMGNRVKEIRSVRDVDELARLGVWLLERGRSRFLSHYSEIRKKIVFRELVYRPLEYVMRHVQRVVQESDGGVIPLLPLLRFLAAHQTRLHNLATNSMADIPFESLMRLLRVKASAYINEFVEKLRNDNNKFVPQDGNVHPITANTLNFLTTLTVHRHIVTHQLLSLTARQGQNTALLLPKLFARILSALGMTLKKKCENYDDINLSTLFLLNNYNYIAKALEDEEDGLLPVINEQNTQILSFYHSEINQCIQQYMRSWNLVVSTLQGIDRIGDDKIMLKNMLNLIFGNRYSSRRVIMGLCMMTSVAWKSASSVIVLSRSTGRVLMMRRGPEAKFMPNAFVFPGGVTTKSDEEIGPPTKVSALRELFEETGLLVTNKGVESAVHSPELKLLQDKTKYDSSLFRFVTKSPPVDQLIDWSTWLTPTSHSRRFLTSFFIININDESPVRMCEKEMSHYIWMKPSECLEKAFLGEISLPPPQVYELTRVDQV
uniref:Nudix hydrolase domain-containing protein n=1 Tax=Heterorhabditis bacteriophora TaxID=37862 RepID=A0A1I7XDB9_HETBA